MTVLPYVMDVSLLGMTQLSQSAECTRNTFNFNEHHILYSCIVKVDTLLGEQVIECVTN